MSAIWQEEKLRLMPTVAKVAVDDGNELARCQSSRSWTAGLPRRWSPSAGSVSVPRKPSPIELLTTAIDPYDMSNHHSSRIH